jgi:hypothetical protein
MAAALVCKHCGYQLTPEEIAENRSKIIFRNIIWLLVLGFLLYACVKAFSESAPPPRAGIAGVDYTPATPLPKDLAVKSERFTWETGGAGEYCRASGRMRNISDETLKFVRVNLEFLRGNKLIDSDSTYLDITELAPGQSSSWTTMYPCPPRAKEAYISASSRGRAIRVE